MIKRKHFYIGDKVLIKKTSWGARGAVGLIGILVPTDLYAAGHGCGTGPTVKIGSQVWNLGGDALLELIEDKDVIYINKL